MPDGLLQTSRRSRTSHSGGAVYADIEAAARDTLSTDADSSSDEYDQPLRGGSGNGNGSYHHGGNGASLQGGSGSHYHAGNGDSLAGLGRRHSDELGDGGSNGDGGALQWEADEEPDGVRQQQQAGRLLWGRGASSVALICLLLTLGSFLVPESEEGLGLIMKHVRSASAAARVWSTTFPARLTCTYVCTASTTEMMRLYKCCNSSSRLHVLHWPVPVGGCGPPRQGVCQAAAQRASLPAAAAAAAQECHREGELSMHRRREVRTLSAFPRGTGIGKPA